MKKLSFINEKAFLFSCGEGKYIDFIASPGRNEEESRLTLIEELTKCSVSREQGNLSGKMESWRRFHHSRKDINCIAQGAIIYSPVKWDEKGNETQISVFLPILEEKYFTPNTFLIDCYNAVVKAIKNNGFVGDYYPHSDSMSTMLCTSIVDNMARYNGERFMNYQKNWNGEKFHSFSDEKMDFTAHGFGEAQTFISVDLFYSNKGKEIAQIVDPMVIKSGVDDIIDLYGYYK